jgi:hypothetical protein
MGAYDGVDTASLHNHERGPRRLMLSECERGGSTEVKRAHTRPINSPHNVRSVFICVYTIKFNEAMAENMFPASTCTWRRFRGHI